MWRSVNVQLVPGLVGGHFCLWSLLTVSGSSWIHTCWARWLGWVYHIWALKGSGLFADRPGFLECMVEGAITGWSPCVQRYSFQMDIIENRIEYVFLPYWRSQLASFRRIKSFTGPRCGERAARYKGTSCVLWLSLCPSSVWVAISQVETARAVSAYSAHLKTPGSSVLFIAASPPLTVYVPRAWSLGVDLPSCSSSSGTVRRNTCGSEEGSLGCLGASSQIPQSPECASCPFLFYLIPTQICRPSVSHLHLIFCQILIERT